MSKKAQRKRSTWLKGRTAGWNFAAHYPKANFKALKIWLKENRVRGVLFFATIDGWNAAQASVARKGFGALRHAR